MLASYGEPEYSGAYFDMTRKKSKSRWGIIWSATQIRKANVIAWGNAVYGFLAQRDSGSKTALQCSPCERHLAVAMSPTLLLGFPFFCFVPANAFTLRAGFKCSQACASVREGRWCERIIRRLFLFLFHVRLVRQGKVRALQISRRILERKPRCTWP